MNFALMNHALQRLPLYLKLMRADKPIGTLLLLWPTLWALWIASGGMPPWHLLLIFVAGVFLMRSAGCVVNDYADRDFDTHVQRTAQRPLATGAVSKREALLLAAALCALAFVLVLFTNRLTILLSFGALALAGSLSFYEALHADAAAGTRCRVRLGDSDGVCGNQQRAATGLLVALYRQCIVDSGLRHVLRDGRSRRRFKNRHQIYCDNVR